MKSPEMTGLIILESEDRIMKNMGSVDRIVRIIVGVVALGAGVYFQSWWGALGLIPLGTGLVGICPLYLPFGIKS